MAASAISWMISAEGWYCPAVVLGTRAGMGKSVGTGEMGCWTVVDICGKGVSRSLWIKLTVLDMVHASRSKAINGIRDNPSKRLF